MMIYNIKNGGIKGSLKVGFLGLVLLFSSCIKDDVLNDTMDPVVNITSSLDTLAKDSSFQLDAMFLNDIGQEEQVDFIWASSDPAIISVNPTGLITAHNLGAAILSASYNNGSVLKDSIQIGVGVNTVATAQERSGIIRTTSSYALTGSFVLKENGSDLKLEVGSDYSASTALPGLFIYLSNNRNSVVNALEIGPVQVFSGAHTYDISGVGINDFSYVLYFCKPFNVKVGDGAIQ